MKNKWIIAGFALALGTVAIADEDAAGMTNTAVVLGTSMQMLF